MSSGLKKHAHFLLVLTIMLLLEGICFWYAFPKIKTNYGKTIYAPTEGNESNFSETLRNQINYTFSFSLEPGCSISGIELLFVTWDNPENIGKIHVSVKENREEIGGDIIDVTTVASWQWTEIHFTPYQCRTGKLSVTVTPDSLSQNTTIAFVWSDPENRTPALKVYDDSWDSFQIFYLVFAVGTAIATVVIICLLRMKHSVKTAFFIIWLWGILMMVFLISPLDGFDEGAHMHWASVMADTLAGYSHDNPEGTLLISKAEINSGLTDNTPDHDYYTWCIDELSKRTSDASTLMEIEKDTVHKGEFPPALFFFYAIGILFARHMSLTGVGIAFLARLFGMIPLIAMIIYILRRLPFGMELVYAILSLPITMQSIATINPDGEILVLSLALTAATIHQMLSCREEKRTWHDLIDYGIIVISCALLSLCKYGAMIPLCLIPLLILLRRKTVKKSATIMALIVSAGSFFGAFLPMLIRLFQERRTSSWSEYYTFSEVFSHPLHSFRILLATIDMWSGYWSRQIIGTMLGNVNILISDAYVMLYTALLVVAMFVTGAHFSKLRRIEWTAFAGIGILGTLCSMGGMMVGATPSGFEVINGVQGRYFLPFLFPILAAITPRKIHFEEENKIKEGFVAIFPLILCFVLTSIFLQS